MVNGSPTNEYLYDTNGNRINLILRKLFGIILHTVVHFLLTIFKFIEPSSTVCIRAAISNTVFSIARRHFDPDVFFNPVLSEA